MFDSCAQLLFLVVSTFMTGHGSALKHRLRIRHNRSEFAPPTEGLTEDVEENIDACIRDAETAAEIETMLQVQERSADAPTFVFPTSLGLGAIYGSVGNKPLTPAPDFLENYQWFSNKIPSSYDTANKDNYTGLPPDFDPAHPYRGQIFPWFHEQTDISSWGHRKWLASPVCLASFVGKKVGTFHPSSNITLFITDFEFRGTDDQGNFVNNDKKRYMSALTCDKLSRYESRIDAAFDSLVEQVTTEGAPVMSTLFEIMIDLYLDLHFGQTNHPGFLQRYLRRTFRVISDLRGTCSPSSPDRDEIKSGYCEALEVKKYITKRVTQVLRDDDKTAFIFWWANAGMPAETIVQEAVHNSLAFSQWMNTAYLIIAAKIAGYMAMESIDHGLFLKQFDFFKAYADASTEAEKLNVVREVFRLTMPNNAWLSTIETKTGGAINSYRNGTLFEDVEFDHTATGHIPFLIQALNDGYDPSTGQTAASNYDTSRYAADFNATGATCPFLRTKTLTPEDLAPSNIDSETIIPDGHEKLIPVYDKSKYCPFGLGYRRCPAELLNYIRNTADFGLGVPSGLFRRPDNIYVKNL
ncbi:hypothetical protein ACA910_020000 [Epithemia clementina (nom. ined.)]